MSPPSDLLLLDSQEWEAISFSSSFEEKEITSHSCGSRIAPRPRPPPAATHTAMPTERSAQARPRVVLRALVVSAAKAATSRSRRRPPHLAVTEGLVYHCVVFAVVGHLAPLWAPSPSSLR